MGPEVPKLERQSSCQGLPGIRGRPLTYVLGLNAYHGDVSAALLRDGQLVAAVEEERFRRIKHWAGFPSLAIRKCLDIAGIGGQRCRTSRSAATRRRTCCGRGCSRSPIVRTSASSSIGSAMPARFATSTHRSQTRSAFRATTSPGFTTSSIIRRISRARSSSLRSTRPRSAPSTASATSSARRCAIGNGNRLDVLDKVYFPHSLGMLYTAVTQYLGFPRLRRRVQGDGSRAVRPAASRRCDSPAGAAQGRRKVRARARLLPALVRRRGDGVGRRLSDARPRVFSERSNALLGPARGPKASR